MPYRTRGELPKGVRDNLPPDAQDIYKDAFNHAWDEYADPARRRDGATREETAHRVAWAAVKRVFEKTDGIWRRKSD